MPCNSLPRLLTSVIFAIGIAGIAVPAASAATADRIPAVASGAPVAIPNSVHPTALSAADLGPAPAETKLGMSIRFTMTDAQSAALDQLLSDQQDPASPRYHQWLTPTQYAAQFGLSSNDIATVSAWLTSKGFTVTGVANGGSFITFDGTVAQAQAAFATSIHNLSVDGETHFANITNISVPGSFAGVVAAVTGLHNFRFKPHLRTSVVKPNYTSSVSQSHFVAPGDIYTIYNVNPLLTTYTGAGVGTGANCHSLPAGTLCGDIAVTGQVDLIANDADVVAFRSASGLSTTNLPTTVHEGGDPGFAICNSCTTGPNESDLAESSIDVEWSGAMATGASILFVNGPDVFFYSMTQAIDQDLAPIITTSYGACEAGWGTTEMISLNTLFKQANAQGQTVLAAAADEGATDCDSGPTASEGLNADFPGSSPYVTSLGGTQFNDGTALGATQYWSASNGTTGGSAVSYIPESVWNDEVLFDSYGGGGGGASAYFTKPAWQVGITTSDGSRDEPDLSLDASDGHEPFLYCVNVPTAVSCGSGYRVSTSNTGLEVAGGTSFDSQIFGGMLALVEQKTGSRIGNANPTIYALGSSVTYYTPGATTASLSTAVFNDVTTGNNAMPCATGTPSCGNGGTEGYSAQPGYDLASGWGSPNVFNMANAWNLVTPRSSGTLGANLSVTNLIINPNCPTSGAACLTTVSSGATVTLVATVVGGGTTPTGTVQFLANNTALASAVSVTALNATTATATYSWVTTCNNLGQNVVSASYSGDTNYQGSIGPVLTAAGASQTSAGSFIVSPLEVQVASTSCPDFSVTPGSTSVTVAAGGTIPAVTITAAALNGFIGTVVFSGTATSSTGYPLTITFSPASITLPTTTSTSLQISGITADLRLPNAPGQTDPGTMLAQQHQGSRLPWYATGSGVTIASLLLLILPRKRRFGGLLLAALSIALIGGATGCGSSQAGPPTTIVSTNPYVGTYFVTVIGTYTNTNTTTGQVTTHSQLVTYTIN